MSNLHICIFCCWALYCTALAGMGYFQSGIDYNKLSHNLESPPLEEQCMADSTSDGYENEEVANSQFELREES